LSQGCPALTCYEGRWYNPDCPAQLILTERSGWESDTRGGHGKAPSSQAMEDVGMRDKACLTVQAGQLKGYLCVVGAAFLWASSGAVGKGLMSQGMGVLELVQARITLAALLMSAAFGFGGRGYLKIGAGDLPYLLLLGILMALNNASYFYAISKIQVAAAILLQYMAPVMVTLYAVLFWGERMGWLKALALGLAVGGCYLVVGGYSLRLLELNREGMLGGLGAAMCFATYTLLAERAMGRCSPWTVLLYAMLFAAVAWHLLMEPFRYLKVGFTLEQWGWLLYIAVAGTVLPFGLYLVGVNHIRSTRAIITATLEPISAALMAFMFLGEALEPFQALGGALVIGAVVLLQLEREHGQALSPENIRSRGRL
jgi:drug/metabolite transporter (DMT)-like permease